MSDITTITMYNPKVTSQVKGVKWVYSNGNQLTGHRWCYLDLPEGGTLISHLFGNPAAGDFEIFENFRPATEVEMIVLKTLEEHQKGI